MNMSLITMSNTMSVVENGKQADWDKYLGNRVCSNDIPGTITDKFLEDILRRQLGGNEIGRLILEDGIQFEKIVYLRRLPKLKSLNMADNPCALIDNFRYYVATFLPDLVYYEYRQISKIEREIGNELFHEAYLIMLERESEELGNLLMKEKEEEDAQLHADSFVEYLNTRRLFESLFESDPEGSALLLIGGEVQNLYVSYEENIVGLCRDIFRMGQQQYSIRKAEIEDFKSGMVTMHQQSQAEAISIMEDFIQKKSELFFEIKTLRNQGKSPGSETVETVNRKLEVFRNQYQEMLHKTRKALMKLETTLYELMGELNETYEHVLTDLTNSFIEQAQGMFSTMRDVVTEYNDSVQEVSQIYFATVVFAEEEAEKDRLEAEKKKIEEEQKKKEAEAKKIKKSGKKKNKVTPKVETTQEKIEEVEDETMLQKRIEELMREKVPTDLKPYVKDREALMNCLAASRDVHLLLIDNREDLLTSRAKDWLQESVRVLTSSEISRNRDKVMEINHFLRTQNEEFELLAKDLLENIPRPSNIIPVAMSRLVLNHGRKQNRS